MTNQEAFDTMVRHLRKQGRKSEAPGGEFCLYRGPDGTKCAVGALIPDEEYQAEWDVSGVRAEKLSCPSLRGVETTLLQSMQTVHDFVGVDRWEHMFTDIAFRYSLTLPPLEAPHA